MSERSSGARPFIDLKTITGFTILHSILNLTSSQCKEIKIGVM